MKSKWLLVVLLAIVGASFPSHNLHASSSQDLSKKEKLVVSTILDFAELEIPGVQFQLNEQKVQLTAQAYEYLKGKLPEITKEASARSVRIDEVRFPKPKYGYVVFVETVVMISITKYVAVFEFREGAWVIIDRFHLAEDADAVFNTLKWDEYYKHELQ